MKETKIEKAIKQYIELQGGWCQRLHSGKIIQICGNRKYAVNMADKGCPDLIAVHKGKFYGIEVKKDDVQKERWIKLYKRYSDGEILPKSYEREVSQFAQCDSIINAGGQYIIASHVDDVIEVLT